MKTATVLVVDDERSIIDIMSNALSHRGHRVRGVESAEDALTALASSTYDLVLLDNVLPGATGMQSLGKLRALTKAPIYVMSGYTGDDTRRDALLLGAAGFLPKPLEIPAIYSLIEKLPEKA